MRILVRLLIVYFVVAATSLQAATYMVPTDRDLVMRSDAIVVATAIASHSEISRGGRIVTIATLVLDEILKGELGGQRSIDLVEPGGVVGNRVTLISGSPRYTVGKQYLVFLRRASDGWATYGFGLGQFEFSNAIGQQILTRGIGEEISGWDELGNAYHVERRRDAIGFQTFVKTVVANPGGPARSGYFLHDGEVATSFSPQPAASVPGGLDGVSAISAATANWNGAGAGVNYSLGVANPSATGGLTTSDHINAVLFNDPANLIPPGVAAAGGYSDQDASGFATEVDVVVGKNFSTNQSTFNALMTHELGHTLGLRHSNEDTGGGSCATHCSSNAIMNAVVNVLSLQQWDLDAIRTVYAGQTGTGVPSDYLKYPRWRNPSATFDYCFAPTISGQPPNKSIVQGGQTSLTVAATGTSATYQWYVGNSPSTTTTAPNGTLSSLTVSPSSTTTYWVRVTACGGNQDSNSATVTVIPCVAPSAPMPTATPATITSGQSSTLAETPTGSGPFTYQWYTGTSGNIASPISGATNSSTTVSPTTTTSYWVRVTGQCAPAANSPAMTVTIAACVPASAPAPNASPATISSGQSSTLSVSPTGTSPFTYQWFVGISGDQSNPISGATNSSTTVSPTVTTSYWVKVTGQCAPVSNSSATPVTVACTPIGVGAQPPTINVGQSSTISVTTSGSGPFTFQWFRGSLGDFSNPIATTSSTVVSPTTSTTYWVRVTAPCGSQDGSVTVFVNAPCLPSSITTNPASPTIAPGASATLTVVAAGTAPISYQWFTGTSGNTSNPIAGATNASVTVTPAVTTSYWVRVSNSCNQTGNNSTTSVVTVSVSCPAPAITTQPASVSAGLGTAATLNVIATLAGNTIHYQWYQGAKGDTSTKVGTDSATFTTGAVSVTTSFWVRLTAACVSSSSTTDSNTAIVTAVAAPRGRAVKFSRD